MKGATMPYPIQTQSHACHHTMKGRAESVALEEAIIHHAQGEYVNKTWSCLRVDIEAICYPAMRADPVSELTMEM
jgi:hypothetical protein